MCYLLLSHSLYEPQKTYHDDFNHALINLIFKAILIIKTKVYISLPNMASYSLMTIAFLESLGILRWVLSIADRFFRIWKGSFEYECKKDDFLYYYAFGSSQS